ncbi:transfer protein [Streptomyces sp. Qhu-G9]|uniref:transfer protein n=1 Tax=Streptomyces sp. Qhu-G9 TaxID=3452799 RepID=UPI0022AC7B36|nr:transfer protein [Streptomyces aurantiacus]WAU84894.1 transfer protein [Streptomyces aurantiacus]
MSTIHELTVEGAPGDIITFDPVRLAGALHIDDPSRLAVETDGMHRALVTIYPADPLAHVRLDDPGLLVMDRHGRLPVGRYHNGRLTRMRLYDPHTGSAQRSFLFGTTGAGKSTANHILLAGEKRSGVITFLADLKGGQSVPEARGNVDWFVRTPQGAMAQLRTAWLVMHELQDIYAGMGRSKFLINQPYRLLSVRIDEANRLLEKGSPYRAEATFYIRDLGRTGRSLGIGIHLSAQASQLDELGGSDTLRSMLKDGDVVLLRWTSSMMRQIVTDGLLPAGRTPAPIPKYAGSLRLVSQFDDETDDEDLPSTAGGGYLLTGPRPVSRMRFFTVGSPMPTTGLDPNILALYGDGPVAGLDASLHKAAGDAYEGRLDGPEAMAAIFPSTDPDAPTAAHGPAPAAMRPGRALTLADRVTAVLENADGPMDARAVLDAVNADGGRTVRLGSVRNTLTTLKS